MNENNNLTSNLPVRPFDFIHNVNIAHLLKIIQREHPQVIALVLSYIEPIKASVILENLPYEMQGDVSGRIAVMNYVNPEIVRKIERVLEKKLSSLPNEDYTAAGGVENIVEILHLVDRGSEKRIIEALENEDPELAEEIKKRMFVFEDIVILDDRSIQKVMREVDSQELAKALKNVDTQVQNKIFRNMSKRASVMLKEDMEYMGPVRLRDVEEAQQKIVLIIRHLEDRGEIIVARTDELVDTVSFFEKEETEKKLPFEENKHIITNFNKNVLDDTDDGTIALAVYAADRNTKRYILGKLNNFRRFKLKCLIRKLKQVSMDMVREAQDEIIDKIQYEISK